ncbi:MAG: hypothetical protein ACO3CS_16330, partial [Alphaproteobacteria bacterium]
MKREYGISLAGWSLHRTIGARDQQPTCVAEPYINTKALLQPRPPAALPDLRVHLRAAFLQGLLLMDETAAAQRLHEGALVAGAEE